MLARGPGSAGVLGRLQAAGVPIIIKKLYLIQVSKQLPDYSTYKKPGLVDQIFDLATQA